MQLSRLEVFGFKTFAKKLDVKLLGGITAIVGPNGCGKTNVVDAIRWVLGEQRPSRIRLESMSDVIFKGSGSRRPLGMAEASLTIENQNGILPVDLPEVTITRRLYRSGESEYLINRKPCRLSDINDMFMDTGMGSDSYSMFEQGMINAILSDKTEDRRHIFEEAAGITKYKARRKSALNTLVNIEGDLERLHDLVTELSRRVESLKRQASKASRYRTLKSELKSRTIDLGAFEIARQKQTLLQVTGQLNAVRSESDAARTEIDRENTALETLTGDIAALEQELAGLSGQYESIIRDIAAKENETARIESRIESLSEMIERSREAVQTTSRTLDTLAVEHGDRTDEQASVQEKLDTIERTHTALEERQRVVKARLAGLNEELRAAEQELRTHERTVEAESARIEHLAARRTENEQRLGDITARENGLRESVVMQERELVVLQTDITRRREELQELVDRRAAHAEKFEHRTAERDELIGRLQDAGEKKASLAAELEFLERLISSLEGYGEGVRNVAQAPCLDGHVRGVLADLVVPEDGYANAVATAFADSLQHLVVDTDDAVRDGSQYLAEEPRGRAAIIALDGAAQDLAELPDSSDGLLGPAAGFVRTDKAYRPLVGRLLARTYVARDLETAMALHDTYPSYRFVTLDGALVGIAGEVVSGTADGGESARDLGRIEKRDRLQAAHAEALQAIDDLERKKQILTDNCAFLKKALAEADQEIEQKRDALAARASEAAQTTARRDTALQSLDSLAGERETLQSSFGDIDRERQEAGAAIEERRAKLAAVETRRNALRRDAEELAADLEAHRQELNECDIDRARLREKHAALRHEIATIEERREALARSSKRTGQEIEQAEAEILSIGERRQALLESVSTLAADREGFENQKTEKSTTLAKLRILRREKEQALQAKRLALVEISNRESALKLEHDEAAMIVSNIIQRLTDEFFITPGDIPESPADPEFEPDREKQELEQLRRKVHAIGDVNLAAEDEYRREKARLDFLDSEYSDLVEARDTLLETISRINHIAVGRFRETFDEIRENFQHTFRKFFEGGVCDLELEQSEDPLEAAIAITARPPGKNVRSISLLSSGERALTAISLLFSIYMVKPSPFCILDEVDAPLDDANIDRFLEVIGEFSQKTQFIMVTHNKKTMSRAHNLYGITMEEAGLSSLVSVRLSEVETYQDEVGAGADTVAAAG